MKVRMKVQISGTHDGQEWPARGGVVELADDEAAGLCAQGLAEPVADTDEPEKAVPPTAEVAEVPVPEKPAAPTAEKRGPGRPRKPRVQGDTSKE
jgi:hypothetical protein